MVDNDGELHESMEKAYPRYIKGQYGVNISQISSIRHITRDNLKRDIFEQLHAYRSKDDTAVEYESFALVEELEFEDFYEERNCVTEPDEMEEHVTTIHVDHRAKRMGIKKALEIAFVRNKFMLALFPELKIQKPGYDLYSYIVGVQVIILTYIFVFFTNMEGSNQNIQQQVETNTLSSSMVI